MAKLRKYLKKTTSQVVAIQLDLETDGFTYQKWGSTQTCKAGDWIVNNGGDVYTVDRDTFARTYRAVSPGIYEKVAPVWAEVAAQPGQIATKEGVTHYKAGAYLVYNEADGKDGYAVEAEAFEKMYEPAE
ncbi:MAG: PGDYG domain-containing protein [Betaproteobacteria bacterium]|nr:PGDYG domain-containing protein [Betaproteobacteria bacterium]MDH3437013.1 PGDYG domain-containing protein [Betaproteobacteria bacterium]